MTQYVKKTFEHAWQAVKAFQENVPLFVHVQGDEYVQVVLHNCLTNFSNLYTIKPTDWREQLDGTVENGVLCKLYVKEVHEVTSVVVRHSFEHGGNVYKTNTGLAYRTAVPVGKSEIAKLMENAPE